MRICNNTCIQNLPRSVNVVVVVKASVEVVVAVVEDVVVDIVVVGLSMLLF